MLGTMWGQAWEAESLQEPGGLSPSELQKFSERKREVEAIPQDSQKAQKSGLWSVTVMIMILPTFTGLIGI